MFRKKHLISSLLLSLCTIGVLSAQSVEYADSLLTQKKYKEAYHIYQQLHKKTPKNTQYLFQMGKSAYLMQDYPNAIEHLQATAEKHPQSHQLLGRIYRQQYHFDKAIPHFQHYLHSIDSTDTKNQLKRIQANTELQKATLAQRLLKRVEKVAFVDSVIVPTKEILKHIPLSAESGKITTQNNHYDNELLTAYTTQRGDKKIYAAHLDHHDKDLYTDNKLLDNSIEEKNLVELNTSWEENYPFLLMDGVTLYYASKGKGSIGGYDILITRLDRETNTYLKPENIGMPFNSIYNDYLMVIDELQNIGWFVSDRYQPTGKVTIYTFIPQEEKTIVKTNDQDTLIQKATLSTFVPTAKINTTKHKPQTTNQHIQHIFIKNKTYYQHSRDFQSNKARNYYHQAVQTAKEIATYQNELTQLRTDYTHQTNPQTKHNIGQKILLLEQKIEQERRKKQKFEKNMRNEEIKTNKDL